MQSSNGYTGDHVSLFPRGVVIKGGYAKRNGDLRRCCAIGTMSTSLCRDPIEELP